MDNQETHKTFQSVFQAFNRRVTDDHIIIVSSDDEEVQRDDRQETISISSSSSESAPRMIGIPSTVAQGNTLAPSPAPVDETHSRHDVRSSAHSEEREPYTGGSVPSADVQGDPRPTNPHGSAGDHKMASGRCNG